MLIPLSKYLGPRMAFFWSFGKSLVPGACRVFQLAFEEEGGIGELFPREAEGGAKENLGRPAPGKGHERPMPFWR